MICLLSVQIILFSLIQILTNTNPRILTNTNSTTHPIAFSGIREEKEGDRVGIID